MLWSVCRSWTPTPGTLWSPGWAQHQCGTGRGQHRGAVPAWCGQSHTGGYILLQLFENCFIALVSERVGNGHQNPPEMRWCS